jgi:gamma-glutamyl:cysteine ligase YbdK (ATP-grasp superfamily)
LNAQFSAVARALTEENRWRAQRYGTTGTYVDVATREAKPFRQMLDETLDLVSPNLTALGLDSEVAQLISGGLQQMGHQLTASSFSIVICVRQECRVLAFSRRCLAGSVTRPKLARLSTTSHGRMPHETQVLQS